MIDRMLVTLQILRGDFAARLSRDEEGATMVEYGLMVALVAVVVAVAATLLGQGIATLFDEVTAQL